MVPCTVSSRCTLCCALVLAEDSCSNWAASGSGAFDFSEDEDDEQPATEGGRCEENCE